MKHSVHTIMALGLLLAWGQGIPAKAQGADFSAESISEQEAVHPGEEALHTVREGDTLWKLAQTYLGDSGQWPALWATNEQIENPNWIYPGEQVQVKPAAVLTGSPSAATARRGGRVGEEEATPFGERIERRAELPAAIAINTLITPGPIEGWGTLESAMVQSEMLSPHEEIHLKIKRESPARPGETFLLLRRQGKLKHPKTGKPLGHITSVVGAIQLYAREGERARGRIVRANDEILRGDMLGPLGEQNLRPLYERRNEKALEGYIVAVDPVKAGIAGAQHVVFVDKGTEDGVQAGNRFHIIRQQDGLSLETVLRPAVIHEGAPKQAVGECTLIDVKTSVSSCLVTRSTRELVPGDKIEMRPEQE